MKGKLSVMMRRWWLIALVLVLALSVTSCSRRSTRTLQGQYGFGYCDGTLGSFDIYVIRSPSQPGLFEISIIPVQLDEPGDIVSITVANQQLAYKTMVNEVVVNTDQEIHAGLITETELYNYDILAITPYQPGVSFLEVVADKDAVCSLPLPSDGFEGM